MLKLARHFKVWWIMLELGSVLRLGAHMTEFYRYHILRILDGEGLFDYLEEPRTWGEILGRFGYMDSDYARELFDIMAEEDRNTIIKQDAHFRRNPAQPLPTFEEVLERTHKRYHKFSLMAEDMVNNIPLRLRSQPVEFSGRFVEQGREMMHNFDELLTHRMYSASRDAAFALIKRRERAWLHGKTLLDVGCGSGRETVELWLHLDGDVRITAIDPVTTLLERAKSNFAPLLDELAPDHPPLTDANRPTFREASAVDLPFDDHTFDAVFYQFILHWTSDPQRVVSEVIRVLKPGGLVFGAQIMKPYWSPYTDILIRSNENSYGWFWREEHERWYKGQGFKYEIAAPLGVFVARKPV